MKKLWGKLMKLLNLKAHTKKSENLFLAMTKMVSGIDLEDIYNKESSKSVPSEQVRDILEKFSEKGDDSKEQDSRDAKIYEER